MADARAGIDVVRAERHADEFLHEVVFLVRAARRRDAADRIAAVLGFDALQILRDVIVGLVPRRLDEVAVVADERLPQAVGVVVKFERVAALEAGVRRGSLRHRTAPGWTESRCAFVATSRLQPTPQ